MVSLGIAMLAVTFGADAAKLKTLEAAFVAMDTDGDGLVNIVEFTAAMAKHGLTDTKQTNEYFQTINQDGTGKIK
jgi:Ca2+-binding EF-hand superfamily protein